MEKYPLLRFLKRRGKEAAFAAALLAGLLVALAAWPLGAAYGIGAGVVAGVAVLAVVLVLSELVRLITDVLMPE